MGLASAAVMARPQVGGGPPWSPADLSPALWIDPSDLSTVTISGSSGAYISAAGLVNLGAAGNYAVVPDHAAYTVTDEFELIAKATASTWASSATIAACKALGSNIAGWRLTTASSGRVYFSHNGGLGADVDSLSSSTLPFTNGTAGWIKVTYKGSVGEVKFFTSLDGVSWTQLGTTQTTTVTTGWDAPGDVWIGLRPGGTLAFNGSIQRVTFATAIGGTPVFDANFETAATYAMSFTESSTTAATVTVASSSYGAAVAQINDKSGNGRHLVQGTLANMPALQRDPASGLTFLSFDGTNDAMKTASADALANPFGVAAVVKMPSPLLAGAYLFDSQTSNADVLVSTLSSTSLRFFAGTSVTAASAVSASELMQISATFDGASSALRKNGAVIASGNIGSNALELLTLGSSASGSGGTWWSGTIHELIFWPNPASFTDVENYLKTKWGTP